jgi:hypothetical protein
MNLPIQLSLLVTPFMLLQDDIYDQSLINHLRSEGIANVTIEEMEAGIEDRFLELMERKLDGEIE